MDRVLIPLIVLAAAILQTTWVGALPLPGGAPDLLLVVVIFFSLQRRTTLGLWAAFWAGLLQDAAGGGVLGLNASILLGVAYLVGLLRAKLFKENVSAQIAIVVALSWLHQFAMFYWMNLLLATHHPLTAWAGRALAMSVYNALLAPLVFRGLGRWIRGEDVFQNLITNRELDSHLRLKRLS